MLYNCKSRQEDDGSALQSPGLLDKDGGRGLVLMSEGMRGKGNGGGKGGERGSRVNVEGQ